MLMQADRSFLLVVDVQEKLLPAIHEAERIERAIEWLLGVAGELEVPVRASEQYPRGLGHTVGTLRERIPEDAITEKTHFSCADAPECRADFDRLGRRQVVVAGIEAHVCVLQTAVRLREVGYDVFVVGDAIGSRNPTDAELAQARLRQLDIQVVSREMVAFEWMHQAGTPTFRRISKNFLR